MSGRRALQACMQVLVLLNLAFVQMTEIAGWHWIGALLVLTLGAPLWAAKRDTRAYRWLWNLGVMGFFAVLIGHARQANLAYVLEDGLVLAVLCQVHLLNNLRAEQRPDLLFLNAFLVAIITGFLTRTLGFALGFLVFAPAMVIGLQLLCATRDGVDLPPDVARRLVSDGSRRAAVLLALSGLAFLFWPRDFHRKALLHGHLQLPTGPTHLEVGFNEVLDLARNGRVERSSQPVMRVTLREGDAGAVPTLWRGATLGATENGSWSRLDPKTMRSVASADERWRGRKGRLTRGTAPAGAPRVEVLRLDPGDQRLFTPLGARALALDPEHADALLRPHTDGNIDADVEGDVRYELVLVAQKWKPAGPRGVVPVELEPYVAIERTAEVAAAERLAERLTKDLPADVPQHEIVERLCDHLSRRFPYLPPGSENAAQTLDEFLEGEAGGHCEFFASALATTLRLVGIPCRVVTGYRSRRWSENDAERTLLFETRDAHAWVEVHDPSAGWYAVDASPIPVDESTGASLWARLGASARAAWATVTGFDQDGRAGLLAWARTVPGRVALAFRERPLPTSALTAGVLLPIALVFLRRRRASEPAIRTYVRALRRAGLERLPNETPRELLLRACTTELPTERLEALAKATRAHEAARYRY